jgi:dihydroxy-acid dehydratase
MPRVLLDQGINDVVRVSDARMSGTSFGTVVLHAAPESAVGGPLAAIETGDEVELDTTGRTITLHVAPDEIERRLSSRSTPPPHYDRGYGWMFLQHVNQADEGCDFDFLRKR